MDNKYLTNRSWETKVSSMPRIPRGENGYVNAFKVHSG